MDGLQRDCVFEMVLQKKKQALDESDPEDGVERFILKQQIEILEKLGAKKAQHNGGL